MKSKTWSCDRGLFSAGLFRKNLSRFWPLWGMASFLGLLMPLAVLFQFVTLPVEFNASKRGLEALSNTGILGMEEETGAKKVLFAAALTYVAAAASSLLQLLRLSMISKRRD